MIIGLTSDLNNFINVKSYGREKPLLASKTFYISQKLLEHRGTLSQVIEKISYLMPGNWHVHVHHKGNYNYIFTNVWGQTLKVSEKYWLTILLDSRNRSFHQGLKWLLFLLKWPKIHPTSKVHNWSKLIVNSLLRRNLFYLMSCLLQECLQRRLS